MNFIKRTVNYFKVRKEKDVAKEILSYITIRNCDYQFIENFKFSMRNKKIF